ncbi:hypothetical protein ES705_18432 [subsurface metagenome]
MEIPNVDISTFLNMVDTFYNNAWNRLVLYGALLVALIGIILPIASQWVSQRIQQGKNIEIENKLRKELTNYVNLKGDTIEKKNINIIDNYFKEKEMEIKDMESLLNKKISYSIGINYHNLAIQSIKEKDYYYTMYYSISAGSNYVDADNEGELKKMLRTIERHCLDLNKIKDAFEVEELKKLLYNIISKLETKYPDKRYSGEIRGIKKNLSKGIEITKNTT